MKWPYIEYHNTGIHVSKERICLFTLSRIGEQVSIVHRASQPVKANNYADALSNLLEGCNLNVSSVSISLDPDKVQLFSKKLSLPLKDVETDNWLEKHSDALLPVGVNKDDFVLEHSFTGSEDGPNYCNSLITRLDTIKGLTAIFEKAGVKITQLTCAVWTSGYAFLFEEEFVNGTKAVLSIYDDPVLVIYQDGQFLTSVGMEASSHPEEFLLEAEAVLAELEISLSQNKVPIVIVCPEENREELREQASLLGLERVLLFTEPLAGMENGEKLPAAYSRAAGMAVAGLYPDLKQVNVLPEDEQFESRQEIQKKDTLNLVLAVGGLTIALLLVLNIVQWYQGSRLDTTERELLQVSGQITQMEKLRENINGLNKQLAGARQLVVQRTYTARMLDRVGQAVPKSLWLSEITRNAGEAENNIVIRGFTTDERKLTQFLERLEKLPVMEEIRLNYSESATAEELEAEMSLRYEEFTLFQIEGRMTAS